MAIESHNGEEGEINWVREGEDNEHAPVHELRAHVGRDQDGKDEANGAAEQGVSKSQFRSME